MGYTFRIKFTFDRRSIGINEPRFYLPSNENCKLYLESLDKKVAIKDSPSLALFGIEYPTKEEAWTAGRMAISKLVLCLAKMKLPADIGFTPAASAFFPYGLAMLSQMNKRPTLNDLPGLQVYESVEDPVFAPGPNIRGITTTSKDKSEEALREGFKSEVDLGERRKLSYELFSLACLTGNIQTKIVMLVTSIEILIDQELRAPESLQHVDAFIDTIQTSDLPDKESLLTSVKYLRKESISSAGKRLVAPLPGLYMGLSAGAFFSRCYTHRSNIVHGNFPGPLTEELSQLYEPLRNLCCDLIAWPQKGPESDYV